MAIGQVKTENITGCRGVLLGSFFSSWAFQKVLPCLENWL